MSQPPHEPWGPQPGWGQPGPSPSSPPWGQQPAPQQPWATPPRPGGGSVPLLVLGAVTALLGALGTFLPSYDYGEGLGSFSPLLQRFEDDSFFQAAGLSLLAGAVLLVVGAVVQRDRTAVGVGLLLVGAGFFVERGYAQLLSLLQSVVDDRVSNDIAVGGVLLLVAAGTGTAVVVLGLLRLARLR